MLFNLVKNKAFLKSVEKILLTVQIPVFHFGLVLLKSVILSGCNDSIFIHSKAYIGTKNLDIVKVKTNS